MQGEIQPMRGEIKVNIRKLGKFGETWKIQKTRNNEVLKFLWVFQCLVQSHLAWVGSHLYARSNSHARWDWHEVRFSMSHQRDLWLLDSLVWASTAGYAGTQTIFIPITIHVCAFCEELESVNVCTHYISLHFQWWVSISRILSAKSLKFKMCIVCVMPQLTDNQPTTCSVHWISFDIFIIAIFVFPYICSFLHCLHHVMLVKVKLDVSW